MTGTSLRERLLQRVAQAFATMPDRFLGAEPGFDATFEIRLGDIGRTWQVRLLEDRCEVKASSRREPDVVIGTDASTWLAIREGRISGLDAFSTRRLYARGDLDLAVGFEGMFALPGGRPPLLRIGEVETASGTMSSLVAGAGDEHVVCLHGLGSNKTSFFETVSALTPDHTVHAVDLPGFGSSSKPARAAYDAPYFARATLGYLDAMAIDRAHLVGNSMGGRVALEVAFEAPDRVASLTLLCPALAFRRRRELWPLVKILRPELAAFPHAMRGELVRQQLWGMFARPERLDPAAADVVADEFCRAYRSRAARVAFFAAARNIYLDSPWGETGFWSRLGELECPSLFVWGDSDRLVPPGFARHVTEALPNAEQVVLTECGHVPQVELPDETNRMIRAHVEAHPVAHEDSSGEPLLAQTA
jgi:pimeloyl-ACP methyl ester carboxylesterase